MEKHHGSYLMMGIYAYGLARWFQGIVLFTHVYTSLITFYVGWV